MPFIGRTTLEELDKLIPQIWPTNYSLPPLGASQLGFHIRNRSVRTGSIPRTPIKTKTMPKRARSSKRSGTRTPAKSFRRRRTTTRRRNKRTLGNIHSFKGIINAGVLSALPAATSAVLGGQFIMKLTDFPVIGSGGALSNSFNFVRLNRCKLEFMPRYNMSSAPNSAAGTTQGEPITFLTGMSEVPIINSAGSSTPAVAPTWSSEGGDAGTVTETNAYADSLFGPTYVRGMPNSRETEIFKKHSVTFIPTFYSYLNSSLSSTGSPTPGVPIFEAKKKTWVNLNFLNQSTATDVQSAGPDYYGPLYTFSGNIPVGGSATAYYDVKLHYSVSFKGLRGIHN